MTLSPALDVDHLKRWIDRTEVAHDVISPRLTRELHATLDRDGLPPASGEPAPLGIHWCLVPPAANTATLGSDGHPTRGDFLPPVPLPRRMWASSALRLQDQLRVGDAVERRSRIADVTAKDGRSGPLCFVGVDHETWTDRGLAITERQTIVYRGMEGASAMPVAAPPSPLAEPSNEIEWHRHTIATTTLLFRYSSLTFNGHRIHYDRDYVQDVEGYPGLVVHGPLQATQLLHFAMEFRERVPTSFSFRGLRPLFDGVPYRLCARSSGAVLSLWIETGNGTRTTEAEAGW